MVCEAARNANITVMAAISDDGWVPVTIRVATGLPLPIKLTTNELGETFFVTMPETWERMAGRSGRAIIRDGVVVGVETRLMT